MDAETIFEISKLAFREPVYPDPRFPPSIYYRFFKLLVAEIRPTLSVELGVCGGGASLHMALGWPNGLVVGVDASNEYPDNIVHIEQTCKNFVFLRGDSVDSAHHIHDHYGPADLLFIDTTHTYEQTMEEWYGWAPFLSPRAIVCLDDLFRPGMDRAWLEVVSMCRGSVRLDDVHDGSPGIGGGFGVTWR